MGLWAVDLGFVDADYVDFGVALIENTFYYNNFSIKEWKGLNISKLKFDFINSTSIFFTKVKQSNVSLI